MVARIKNNKSIKATLQYNESKLQQGKAVCIAAENYLANPNDLTWQKKLQRLQQQADLNKAAGSNCVHISLNFHRDDQLDNDKLKRIAQTYMKSLGFEHQPYLVYRHKDAAHPHIHIVSTNIEANGKRIDMHNIGKTKSEPIRKQIEKDFNLIVAGSRNQAIKNGPTLKLQYGEDPTVASINKILDTVLNKYLFTSIPELNAVLQLYNLLADTGNEGSKLKKQNGLVYKIVKDGKVIGVGVTASDLQNKPTLERIESIARLNCSRRITFAGPLKDKVDTALYKSSSFETFRSNLSKQQIHIVDRYAKTGQLYGLTYIEHKTGAVFNGSDLGKAYSAKSIAEKFGLQQSQQQHQQHQNITHQKAQQENTQHAKSQPPEAPQQKQTILDAIIDPNNTNAYLPWQLKRKKRKRKK